MFVIVITLSLSTDAMISQIKTFVKSNIYFESMSLRIFFELRTVNYITAIGKSIHLLNSIKITIFIF